MERVKFIGLQYNHDGTKYYPLVNNRIGSTVVFNPGIHRIKNVDDYNDCLFSEAMLRNPNKDLFIRYPGSFELAL